MASAQFTVPAALLAIGPGGLIPTVVLTPVIVLYAAVRLHRTSAPPHPATRLAIRAAWLSVAVLGLLAVLGDIHAITRLS